MADAADIHGVVFKDGSATLLARVVGANGVNLVQANLTTAKYTVYLLDDDDPDSLTAVSGHEDVSVEVAALIYDTLQDDELWDVDGTGYNLKHVIDVSTNQAFAVAGSNYLIVFTLTPTSGQPILVRFRVRAI